MKNLQATTVWVLLCSTLTITEAAPSCEGLDSPYLTASTIPWWTNPQNSPIFLSNQNKCDKKPVTDPELTCISTNPNIINILQESKNNCKGQDYRVTFYLQSDGDYIKLDSFFIDKHLFHDVLMKYSGWSLTSEKLKSKTKEHNIRDDKELKDGDFLHNAKLNQYNEAPIQSSEHTEFLSTVTTKENDKRKESHAINDKYNCFNNQDTANTSFDNLNINRYTNIENDKNYKTLNPSYNSKHNQYEVMVPEHRDRSPASKTINVYEDINSKSNKNITDYKENNLIRNDEKNRDLNLYTQETSSQEDQNVSLKDYVKDNKISEIIDELFQNNFDDHNPTVFDCNGKDTDIVNSDVMHVYSTGDSAEYHKDVNGYLKNIDSHNTVFNSDNNQEHQEYHNVEISDSVNICNNKYVDTDTDNYISDSSVVKADIDGKNNYHPNFPKDLHSQSTQLLDEGTLLNLVPQPSNNNNYHIKSNPEIPLLPTSMNEISLTPILPASKEHKILILPSTEAINTQSSEYIPSEYFYDQNFNKIKYYHGYEEIPEYKDRQIFPTPSSDINLNPFLLKENVPTIISTSELPVHKPQPVAKIKPLPNDNEPTNYQAYESINNYYTQLTEPNYETPTKMPLSSTTPNLSLSDILAAKPVIKMAQLNIPQNYAPSPTIISFPQPDVTSFPSVIVENESPTTEANLNHDSTAVQQTNINLKTPQNILNKDIPLPALNIPSNSFSNKPFAFINYGIPVMTSDIPKLNPLLPTKITPVPKPLQYTISFAPQKTTPYMHSSLSATTQAKFLPNSIISLPPQIASFAAYPLKYKNPIGKYTLKPEILPVLDKKSLLSYPIANTSFSTKPTSFFSESSPFTLAPSTLWKYFPTIEHLLSEPSEPIDSPSFSSTQVMMSDSDLKHFLPLPETGKVCSHIFQSPSYTSSPENTLSITPQYTEKPTAIFTTKNEPITYLQKLNDYLPSLKKLPFSSQSSIDCLTPITKDFIKSSFPTTQSKHYGQSQPKLPITVPVSINGVESIAYTPQSTTTYAEPSIANPWIKGTFRTSTCSTLPIHNNKNPVASLFTTAELPISPFNSPVSRITTESPLAVTYSQLKIPYASKLEPILSYTDQKNMFHFTPSAVSSRAPTKTNLKPLLPTPLLSYSLVPLCSPLSTSTLNSSQNEKPLQIMFPKNYFEPVSVVSESVKDIFQPKDTRNSLEQVPFSSLKDFLTIPYIAPCQECNRPESKPNLTPAPAMLPSTIPLASPPYVTPFNEYLLESKPCSLKAYSNNSTPLKDNINFQPMLPFTIPYVNQLKTILKATTPLANTYEPIVPTVNRPLYGFPVPPTNYYVKPLLSKNIIPSIPTSFLSPLSTISGKLTSSEVTKLPKTAVTPYTMSTLSEANEIKIPLSWRPKYLPLYNKSPKYMSKCLDDTPVSEHIAFTTPFIKEKSPLLLPVSNSFPILTSYQSLVPVTTPICPIIPLTTPSLDKANSPYMYPTNHPHISLYLHQAHPKLLSPLMMSGSTKLAETAKPIPALPNFVYPPSSTSKLVYKSTPQLLPFESSYVTEMLPLKKISSSVPLSSLPYNSPLENLISKEASRSRLQGFVTPYLAPFTNSLSSLSQLPDVPSPPNKGYTTSLFKPTSFLAPSVANTVPLEETNSLIKPLPPLWQEGKTISTLKPLEYTSPLLPLKYYSEFSQKTIQGIPWSPLTFTSSKPSSHIKEVPLILPSPISVSHPSKAIPEDLKPVELKNIDSPNQQLTDSSLLPVISTKLLTPVPLSPFVINDSETSPASVEPKVNTQSYVPTYEPVYTSSEYLPEKLLSPNKPASPVKSLEPVIQSIDTNKVKYTPLNYYSNSVSGPAQMASYVSERIPQLISPLQPDIALKPKETIYSNYLQPSMLNNYAPNLNKWLSRLGNPTLMPVNEPCLWQLPTTTKPLTPYQWSPSTKKPVIKPPSAYTTDSYTQLPTVPRFSELTKPAMEAICPPTAQHYGTLGSGTLKSSVPVVSTQNKAPSLLILPYSQITEPYKVLPTCSEYARYASTFLTPTIPSTVYPATTTTDFDSSHYPYKYTALKVPKYISPIRTPTKPINPFQQYFRFNTPNALHYKDQISVSPITALPQVNDYEYVPTPNPYTNYFLAGSTPSSCQKNADSAITPGMIASQTPLSQTISPGSFPNLHVKPLFYKQTSPLQYVPSKIENVLQNIPIMHPPVSSKTSKTNVLKPPNSPLSPLYMAPVIQTPLVPKSIPILPNHYIKPISKPTYVNKPVTFASSIPPYLSIYSSPSTLPSEVVAIDPILPTVPSLPLKTSLLKEIYNAQSATTIYPQKLISTMIPVSSYSPVPIKIGTLSSLDAAPGLYTRATPYFSTVGTPITASVSNATNTVSYAYKEYYNPKPNTIYPTLQSMGLLHPLLKTYPTPFKYQLQSPYSICSFYSSKPLRKTSQYSSSTLTSSSLSPPVTPLVSTTNHLQLPPNEYYSPFKYGQFGLINPSPLTNPFINVPMHMPIPTDLLNTPKKLAHDEPFMDYMPEYSVRQPLKPLMSTLSSPSAKNSHQSSSILYNTVTPSMTHAQVPFCVTENFVSPLLARKLTRDGFTVPLDTLKNYNYPERHTFSSVPTTVSLSNPLPGLSKLSPIMTTQYAYPENISVKTPSKSEHSYYSSTYRFTNPNKSTHNTPKTYTALPGLKYSQPTYVRPLVTNDMPYPTIQVTPCQFNRCMAGQPISYNPLKTSQKAITSLRVSEPYHPCQYLKQPIISTYSPPIIPLPSNPFSTLPMSENPYSNIALYPAKVSSPTKSEFLPFTYSEYVTPVPKFNNIPINSRLLQSLSQAQYSVSKTPLQPAISVTTLSHHSSLPTSVPLKAANTKSSLSQYNEVATPVSNYYSLLTDPFQLPANIPIVAPLSYTPKSAHNNEVYSPKSSDIPLLLPTLPSFRAQQPLITNKGLSPLPSNQYSKFFLHSPSTTEYLKAPITSETYTTRFPIPKNTATMQHFVPLSTSSPSPICSVGLSPPIINPSSYSVSTAAVPGYNEISQPTSNANYINDSIFKTYPLELKCVPNKPETNKFIPLQKEIKARLSNYINNNKNIKSDLYHSNVDLSIPLGSIIADKQDYDNPIVHTVSPSIGLRMWPSNLKLLEAKLELKFKDVLVNNFQPVVNNFNTNDLNEVINLVKNYIRNKYGDVIVIDDNKYLNNEYEVLKHCGDERDRCNLLWPVDTSCHCVKPIPNYKAVI